MTTIFETQFQSYLPKIINVQSTNKRWKIKGFIDSQEHIYEITNDTKVVSKLIEIILFSSRVRICKFFQLSLLSNTTSKSLSRCFICL